MNLFSFFFVIRVNTYPSSISVLSIYVRIQIQLLFYCDRMYEQNEIWTNHCVKKEKLT